MDNNKIDYERSFKKLVDQIKTEYGWATDETSEVTDPYYRKGMVFAYRSIMELAIKLEKGEFFED